MYIHIVTLGSTSHVFEGPKERALVPEGYADASLMEVYGETLEWMLQKEVLDQDVFVLGDPGSLRRALVLSYCELAEREVEYMAISRDTTESDLKQRREISQGSIRYVDQAAVRAAKEGRVLVLDGIEKAERNVMPILNNLLENREMNLESGQHLISSESYDALAAKHGIKALEAWGMIRVHPDFRVMVLGLPVPPYEGNRIDPPFRSRFQGKVIQPPSAGDLISLASARAPDVDPSLIQGLVGYALVAHASSPGGSVSSSRAKDGARPKEAASGPLKKGRTAPIPLVFPFFPGLSRVVDAVQAVASQAPELTSQVAATMMEATFPWKMALEGGASTTVAAADQAMEVATSRFLPHQPLRLDSVTRDGDSLVFRSGSSEFSLPWSLRNDAMVEGVEVADPVVAHAVFDLAVGHDSALVGGRGVGKSHAARAVASVLGADIQVLPMYKDMSTRDLLMRRTTGVEGDTAWEPTPLVLAALEGSLCVLDGIDRMDPGSLSVLQRLLHERSATLPNGLRLVPPGLETGATPRSQEAVLELLRAADASQEAPVALHPGFRVLGLGLTPTSSSSWITSESVSLFRFHGVGYATGSETRQLVTSLFPNLPAESVDRITSPSLGLSLRQILHVAKRVERYPGDERDAVERTLLLAFLPAVERSVQAEALDNLYGATGGAAGVEETDVGHGRGRGVEITVTGEKVRIGEVEAERARDVDPTLVPRIEHRFSDIPSHTAVLGSLLKDYQAGESLLLIGPQGVGKNMLCDRFLELLNLPRQYIQLHRDSSVMSLTSNPSFEGGVLSWGDSPLVKAAVHGHVLVIDEADKAPLEVVAVLKALVEDAHMLLPDGRKLVDPSAVSGPNDVGIHPRFRVIVLANKPGFPFLGNDFYRECGDLFAVHSIDNPDPLSELMMLKAHAVGVEDELLTSLTGAFRDLRAAVDAGVLSYPYSSRELVAIVRHASKFPDSGLAGALHNVFDFDAHDPAVVELLASTFRAHGLPLGITPSFKTELAKPIPLGSPSVVGSWRVERGESSSVECEVTTSEIEPDAEFSWVPPRSVTVTGDGGRSGLAANVLNEHVGSVRVPCAGPPIAVDVMDGHMVVVGSSPESLYTYSADRREVSSLELFSSSSPSSMSAYGMSGRAPVPDISMGALGKDKMVFLTYEEEGLILDLEASKGFRFELPPSSSSGSRGVIPQFQLFGSSSSSSSKTSRSSGGGSPDFPVSLSGSSALPSSGSRSGDVVVNTALGEETGEVVLYTVGGDLVHVVHPKEGKVESIHLPSDFEIACVDVVSPLVFLVRDGEGVQKLLEAVDGSTARLSPVVVEGGGGLERSGMGVLHVSGQESGTLVVGEGVCVAMDRDDGLRSGEGSGGELVGWERLVDSSGSGEVVVGTLAFQESRDVVSVVEGEGGTYGVEVVDLEREELRRFSFDPSVGSMGVGGGGGGDGKKGVTLTGMRELPNGCLGMMFSDGSVHVFKVNASALEAELAAWQAFVGASSGERGKRIRMEKQRLKHKEASGPKHGKIDPENTPHVGGNQWHGGTGGADTAGLGGVGGPYRVDAGHNVHQVPDSVKEALDEETKAAARAMGEAALAERLKEISMSSHEAGLYDRYLGTVEPQIRELQVLLDSMEAKNKERTWVGNQTSGDLDEAKLVEGLTGESNVYKRRGEPVDAAGGAQLKPKKMMFVLDVSGSMYRFNGLDGRLERLLVATLMIMEGLAPGVASGTLEYSIVGHSGGSPCIPLVSFDDPPSNEAERLRVLQTMAAHAQYCPSGDHTVEAAELAMEAMAAEEDADEKFVFIVSDANLARYGIPATALASAVDDEGGEGGVKPFVVMLASFGDEADEVMDAVGVGSAFLCEEPGEVVDVFRQVVRSTLM